MQRNPILHQKQNYFKSIAIKKIRPLFFFTECVKCGFEYKKEPMYECRYKISPFLEMYGYARGCSHCFKSKDDFRKYLEDKELILNDNTYNKRIQK